MKIDLEDLLSPRIVKHCMPLYSDGHYKHAAFEAMKQVELALKEKGEVKDKKFGVTLVRSLFGKGQGIKLRVPFGEDMQSKAEILFEGAFSYYRNYAAHDGRAINEPQCLRIMVLASELLELIGVSSLSFADVGGVDGLVKAGAFKNKEELLSLLKFLDSYTLPDEVIDGFYEDFYGMGFEDSQLDAVIELDLVHYRIEDYVAPAEIAHLPGLPYTVGWFELTDLGKEAVTEGAKTDHAPDEM